MPVADVEDEEDEGKDEDEEEEEEEDEDEDEEKDAKFSCKREVSQSLSNKDSSFVMTFSNLAKFGNSADLPVMVAR